MSIDDEIKLKIILLGNGSVGKTSLSNRYTVDRFSSTYKPSLGVDFMVKRENYEGRKIKIMVFDTAGQEYISTLRKRYYTGAHGAVIVYDITSRKSFEDLDKWVSEVKGEVGDIKTVFVGNKIDLDDRQVSTEEAKAYAEKNHGLYFESSAKFGDGVRDIFVPFMDEILNKINEKNKAQSIE